MTFTAQKGTTYYIGVDGLYADGLGPAHLQLVSRPPPENDFFADAQDLGDASSVVVDGTTIAATTERYEPTHSNSVHPSGSVWYRWTARDDGVLSFDVSGDFDPVVGVYTGSRLSDLEHVEGRFPGWHGDPRQQLAVRGGTTYWLAVDKWSKHEAGDFVLRLNGPGRPLPAPVMPPPDGPTPPAVGTTDPAGAPPGLFTSRQAAAPLKVAARVRRTTIGTALRRGLSGTVSCSLACAHTVAATFTLRGRSRKSVRSTSAGRGPTFSVRPGPKARRRLRGARIVDVRLRITASAGAQRVTTTRGLTLRR
jgi:hypothetical protein